MIWITLDDASYQAIETNLFQKGEKHEVWITRANGKTLKIMEGTHDQVKEIKDAIDYAVKQKMQTLDLRKMV